MWDDKFLDLQVSAWVAIMMSTCVVICAAALLYLCVYSGRRKQEPRKQPLQYILPPPPPESQDADPEPVSFLAVENTVGSFVEYPVLSPGSKKAYLHITQDSMHKFYTQHNPENVPQIDAILQTLATNQILRHCNDKYNAIPETTLVASVAQDPGSPKELQDPTQNSTVDAEGDFKFLPGTITRQSLITFYQKYCPEKADRVDEILEFYDPGYLLRTLQNKYGDVPDGSYVVSPEGRAKYTFRAGRMKNESFLPVNEEGDYAEEGEGGEGVEADCLPQTEVADDSTGCAPPRDSSREIASAPIEHTPTPRMGKKSQGHENVDAYLEPSEAGCL
jgi:hypothetical protein